MRTISDVALAEITKEFGLESILIVRVFWNDFPVDYSDKAVEGLVGKVLDISGIDDILNIDNGSTATTVTVKLDDSDESILGIINNRDVHKRPVQILYLAAGLPLSEAFVIFSGFINTPMEWSEGERSFQFTAVNLVENLEFGFSLEEGIFTNLPAPVYGQAIPTVFGSVLRVPSVMLSESPSGILAQGFAWLMRGKDLVEGGSELTLYEKHLAELLATAGQAFQQSQLLYGAAAGASLLASFYNDGRDLPFPDDYSTYQSYAAQSAALYQQSEQMLVESLTIRDEARRLREDYEQKQEYAHSVVQVSSINFPRGRTVLVEIEGTRFLARFDGTAMSILDYVLPSNLRPGERYLSQLQDREVSRVYQAQETETKFKWFDGGSKIRVLNVPLYYAACFGQNPTIKAVYARMQGVRVRVPNSYYTIQRIPFSNSLTTAWITVIRMNQPISTILDASGQALYESDDIWCDIAGEVPGYYSAIVAWTVATFSTLSLDSATFTAIQSLTINQPMNFAVLDRKNVWDFLREVSYQARTSIWVNDNKVYFHYLPVEQNHVETITPDDVVEDTLVVTSNDTESIVTKTIAHWRPMLDQQEPNKYIIRQNVAKYGLQEETTNYYAFQTAELVRRAAAFWSVRKGNVWKKIQFKTWIHKLKIESHDTILLSGWNQEFSRTDVKGIVESAVYDSASNTIDVTVWLPIRWGEMDPYVFAYPTNVYEFFGSSFVENFTGSPFFDVQDTGGFMAQVGATFISYGPMRPQSSRVPEQIADTPPQYTVDTAVSQNAIDALRVDGLRNANDFNRYTLLKLPTIDGPETASSTVKIGTIVGSVEGDNTLYTVQPVGGGAEITVRQLKIAEGFTLVIGTPVYVVKQSGTWYMQSPVWAKE